jgi:hypothetical protein
LDRERSPRRAFGIVLLRHWITKQHHQPVAQLLGHMTAQFGRSPRGSPHFGQLEQLFMSRNIFGIWQRHMRNLASLTMLGVALTTQ